MQKTNNICIYTLEHELDYILKEDPLMKVINKNMLSRNYGALLEYMLQTNPTKLNSQTDIGKIERINWLLQEAEENFFIEAGLFVTGDNMRYRVKFNELISDFPEGIQQKRYEHNGEKFSYRILELRIQKVACD